jgi:hypothetical protein
MNQDTEKQLNEEQVEDSGAPETDASQENAAEEAAFAGQFDNEQQASDGGDELTDGEAGEDGEEEEAGQDASGEESDEGESQEGAAEVQKLLDDLNRLTASSEMTDKRIQQIHGKLGEVNRALNELRGSGSGAGVRASPEMFKNLAENYGEELAEALAKDLAGISLGGGGGVNEELIEARVSKVRDEMSQQMQIGLLTIMHPDWKTVRQTEEFGKWKQTLSQEELAEFNASWQAETVGSYLTKFKDWRNKKTTSGDRRREILQRNLNPKGTHVGGGKRLVTEEDAFNAQFQT